MSMASMPEPKTADQITKREFQAYERVRQSGRYNMMTNAGLARRDTGLSQETYYAILRHYSALAAKWPEVRDDA